MKEILTKYGIPEEIVNVFMMLYNNTLSMVHSPDGDTHFFEITTCVTGRHTSTIYFYNLPPLYSKNIFGQ